MGASTPPASVAPGVTERETLAPLGSPQVAKASGAMLHIPLTACSTQSLQAVMGGSLQGCFNLHVGSTGALHCLGQMRARHKRVPPRSTETPKHLPLQHQIDGQTAIRLVLSDLHDRSMRLQRHHHFLRVGAIRQPGIIRDLRSSLQHCHLEQ